MTRNAVLAPVVLTLLASCTMENRPSPRDPARYYGTEIVFCPEKVEHPDEACDSRTSVSTPTIVASVLVGSAGGRVVEIEMDGPGRGTFMLDPVSVEAGKSLSYWFTISRSSSCRELPCTIAVNVYVDGEFADTSSVTFS
jgi:hypothetical protein